MRVQLLCAGVAASLLIGGAAQATVTINLGTAGAYALVATADGKKVAMNSGPLTGNVLLGNGEKAAFSGGGGGDITGTLYYDATVTGTNTFNQLDTHPVTQLVGNGVALQAMADAQQADAAIQALAATQTFGAITTTTTITGNGGLNVIHLASLQNAILTLTGGANDYFVFDVAGIFASNQAMILNGVSANHIIWDITATSGNAFQTSGGDTLYGTFLATHGANFQFSNLNLDGALINTAGDVQFVSGSQITKFDSFVGPRVPEPSAWALMILGLGGLGGMLRRRRPLAA